MTLPATAPIKLSDIIAAFAAPDGTGFASMLKGGLYVPETTVADIPEELPISMSDFLGSVAPASAHITGIAASSGSVSNVAIDSLTASVTLSHATQTGSTSVTKAAAMTVSFMVDRATTPKLRLAVRATNPSTGGFRCPVASFAAPTFDNGVT